MTDLVKLSQVIRKMEEREKPFCADCIPTIEYSGWKCPVGIPGSDYEFCEANLENAPTANIKIEGMDGGIYRIKVLVCPECYSKIFA